MLVWIEKSASPDLTPSFIFLLPRHDPADPDPTAKYGSRGGVLRRKGANSLGSLFIVRCLLSLFLPFPLLDLTALTHLASVAFCAVNRSMLDATRALHPAFFSAVSDALLSFLGVLAWRRSTLDFSNPVFQSKCISLFPARLAPGYSAGQFTFGGWPGGMFMRA